MSAPDRSRSNSPSEQPQPTQGSSSSSDNSFGPAPEYQATFNYPPGGRHYASWSRLEQQTYFNTVIQMRTSRIQSELTNVTIERDSLRARVDTLTDMLAAATRERNQYFAQLGEIQSAFRRREIVMIPTRQTAPNLAGFGTGEHRGNSDGESTRSSRSTVSAEETGSTGGNYGSGSNSPSSD